MSDESTNPEPIKTVEAWFAALAPEAWQHHAAQCCFGWPVGKELTEAQYKAALDEAAHVVVG